MMIICALLSLLAAADPAAESRTSPPTANEIALLNQLTETLESGARASDAHQDVAAPILERTIASEQR